MAKKPVTATKAKASGNKSSSVSKAAKPAVSKKQAGNTKAEPAKKAAPATPKAKAETANTAEEGKKTLPVKSVSTSPVKTAQAPAKAAAEKAVKPAPEAEKTVKDKIQVEVPVKEKAVKPAEKVQAAKTPAPAPAKAAPEKAAPAKPAVAKEKKNGTDTAEFVPKVIKPQVVAPGEEVVVERPKTPYIAPKDAQGPRVYVRQVEAKIENENKPINKELMRFPISSEDLKKGVTVEQKLRALYDIQLIDTRIDKLRSARGELPLEVDGLADEVSQLETRLQNLNNEMGELDKDISSRKQSIKDAEALIKKYKEQQDKVRNNREFESLAKEMEFQELEILGFKKKIKESEIFKVTKGDVIAQTELKLNERKADLQVKRDELNEIIRETETEETLLVSKSDEARKLIEPRLLQAYERIRGSSRNGLAVVPIEREASAGSFITLPPQKQLDVAARKKVIVDEHSGRIIVDADLAREEEERISNILSEALKK
jgi:predicted  nucleic acid-binding Zn-ribbon protein